MLLEGLKDSNDKLKQLHRQYNLYTDNASSTDQAYQICITAWHLIEWVFNEFKSQQMQLNDFRLTLYSKCKYLKVVGDIANAIKHRDLTRPKASIKSIKLEGSTFSNVFSIQFETVKLIVELQDKSILEFEEVINSVVDFWIFYFKTELKLLRETRLHYIGYSIINY